MNPNLKTGLIIAAAIGAGAIVYQASGSLTTDVKVVGGVAAGGVSLWILAFLFL
jgi:hypothetical protein